MRDTRVLSDAPEWFYTHDIPRIPSALLRLSHCVGHLLPTYEINMQLWMVISNGAKKFPGKMRRAPWGGIYDKTQMLTRQLQVAFAFSFILVIPL